MARSKTAAGEEPGDPKARDPLVRRGLGLALGGAAVGKRCAASVHSAATSRRRLRQGAGDR